MFKFGFLPDEEPAGGAPAGGAAAPAATAAAPPPPAFEVAAGPNAAAECAPLETVAVAPGVELSKRIVSAAQAAAWLGQGGVAASDLIPGAYGGGFKLWEGGLDLARFAAARLGAAELAGAVVADLGCGHGLPGAVALLAGAAAVLFQDYNAEVLARLAAPNAAATWAAAGRPGAPPARFLAGDWAALAPALGAAGFAAACDVVLSAETIYSAEAARGLLVAVKQCLKRPGGVAYIAAKSHYFGVGGGVPEFLALVAADSALTAERVEAIEDGVSTRREILRLAWRAGGV